MKKLSYLVLGAAGLLMASCSQDDMPGISKGDGNYNLRVKLPVDLATRALSDGLKADNLHIAVYDADNDDALVFEAKEYFNGQLETYVSLDLSQGKTYDIAFFAVSKDGEAVYEFDAENHLFTVDYDEYGSAANLADAYDCFYQLDNTGVIGSTATEKTVTLYRPVAQINWGANDLNEKAVVSENAYGTNGKYIVTTLTATNAYTEFDFFTKDVSGAPGDVTLKALASPAAGENSASWQFPVEPENYKYVAMQYMLAPQQPGVSDLTLNINNGGNPNKELAPVSANDVVVATAPLQANYRTNIYGTLLTDNMNFNVRKDPRWGEPDYNVNLNAWDGVTVTIPVPVDGVYDISSADEFAGLLELAHKAQAGGTNGENYGWASFVDKTIKLSADIDMGGFPLEPIGYYKCDGGTGEGASSNAPFVGTFDGQGYTISNFTIKRNENQPAADGYSLGFFGATYGAAVIKDVNFSNFKIEAEDGNVGVGIVGVVINGAKISNVNVLSGTISGGECTGSVVGMAMGNGTAITIDGCTNAATISGDNRVGGIVGFAAGVNVKVTNCKNTGNVSSSNYSLGGIVGEVRYATEVSGCTNDGTVTFSGSNGYGVGGIVGWVRYNPFTGIAKYGGFAKVNENTNNGNVYGSYGAGGIVGTWYWGGFCESNTNNAKEIVGNDSATGGAAGIVGYSFCAGGNQPEGAANGNNYLFTANNNTSTTPAAGIKGGYAWTMFGLAGTPGVNGVTFTGSGNTPENERIQ